MNWVNQVIGPWNIWMRFWKCNFQSIGIFKPSYDNAFIWMPQFLTDDKSTLIQVMAWCRQAISHYPGQCWFLCRHITSLGHNEWRRFRSPTTWIFVQQHVQANKNRNAKAPLVLYEGDPPLPGRCGKCFHVMIASWSWSCDMMTSSNGNIFRVIGPLCGEFTSHRWIPRTKAGDAELWCFLWSAPE